MTAPAEKVGEAAAWLALQSPPPSPLVTVLRERFGLTPLEACLAAKAAATIQHGRAS
jgi:hypothetical protein